MTAASGHLPLTPTTPRAGEQLDAAVESYLASRADTPAILKQAMADDPEHLMARCLMGYLLRLAGDASNARGARAVHEGLCQQLESGAGNAWERAHVAALGLWLDDHLDTLMAHLEQLLEAYPTDVLALRMLHYLYFYDGDAARMRDSVRTRIGAYAGHPLEGYVTGMLAFGHEEAGDFEAAERLGRSAVAIHPDDIWAAHAVAHVMEMQGRPGDGIDWIRARRPDWGQANNFRFHLDWHEALFHLAVGDLPAVLDLYDRHVAPAVADDFYLDLCNAASLLLRIEAAGGEVGDRWQPLAALAERHVGDTELVFASLHYLIPLLVVDSPAATDLLATLQRWSRIDTAQGRVVRDVALDVAAFLQAVRRGDAAAASRTFAGFRARLHRIGGSHAQRDLFRLLARAA